MVTTIVDINLSISVVTLEANDLKVSINRFSECMKLYAVYERPILDVNILQFVSKEMEEDEQLYYFQRKQIL